MTESTFMPPRAWRALHGNALPWSLLLPLALLALWHVAAAAQWLPPQTLPAPREVLHTLLQLAGSGELFVNLAISLAQMATPYSIKDHDNQLQGQIRSTSVFLQETGGAGTMQKIDLAV